MTKFLNRFIWFSIVSVFAASVLPNLFISYWFIDLFAHFKVQYIVVSTILVAFVFLFLKEKRIALFLLVVSILWNCYFVLPYYFSLPEQPRLNKETLKVSSINLLSSNSKPEEVKTYIKKEDADIIVLMEVTPQWEQELSRLKNQYSFHEFVTRTDNFGIALLSKQEMAVSIKYFGDSQMPSIVGGLKIGAENLSLVATHPVPPMGQTAFRKRNSQLKNIIENRNIFHENLVIIGDFNMSSFTNHFVQLTKKDLRDSRKGFGLLPTWPTNIWPMQTTLDHCLVSSKIIVQDRSVGNDLGSDHLPINILIGLN
tara:strand:+ start:39860 stop:40795 length:936 start_codon:yes stop_codon:yes gene_type:complete